MKNLKISIITATFNNVLTIESTLKSVAEQNYTDVEHIIVDGLSTDGTLSIIERYPHIIKKISEKDEGIYFALNKGIQVATGDVIGFLHADDFLTSSGIVSKIAETFKQYSCDAIYGDLDYVSAENPDVIIRHWQSKPFTFNLLRKGWMPPHPTFFMKRKIYEKYGFFDTNFKISADYDLMLRILSKNISTHYLHIDMVKMRTGGESNKSLKKRRCSL